MIKSTTLYSVSCDVGRQKNPHCHDTTLDYPTEEKVYEVLEKMRWQWKQNLIGDESTKFVCPMCLSKKLYPEGWDE